MKNQDIYFYASCIVLALMIYFGIIKPRIKKRNEYYQFDKNSSSKANNSDHQQHSRDSIQSPNSTRMVMALSERIRKIVEPVSSKIHEIRDKFIKEGWDDYLKMIGVILMIIIGGVIWGLVAVMYNEDVEEKPKKEYETYYIDENGNGKFDRGESNYTQDQDGNVVDWDEDENNF